MLAKNLVALRREHGLPDLIGIEKWLAVNAQPSDKNIETSLRLDGAANAVAGVWGVPVATLDVNTIRATVCGAKSAVMAPSWDPENRASRSGRKDAQRMATKQMVIKTMILLGLLPTGCKDDNRADAVCGWRYCEAVYGRMAPKEFVLL